MIDFNPIGVVSSPVSEPVDHSWRQVVSEIHLNSELSDGVIGLSDFSHLVVVFYMHLASFDPMTDLVRRPHGRDDMPLIGIFAQRARHRPNPIGITTVELLEVNGTRLKVKGLDAVDRTPVLDIKPFFPAFDSADNQVIPEWMERLMRGYF